MNARCTTLLRLTAGLALIVLLSACTAVGTGATSAPIDPTSPLASNVPSVVPSIVPAASVAAIDTASPSTAPAAGGGGRYGTGATPTPAATPTSKPAPKPTPKPTTSPSLTVRSGSTSLGTVLVGADGLTLYTHAGDTSTHSSCTGGCPSAWPPLLVKAGTKVKGGAGVHGAFTTFKRSDGTTQVAYQGKPLYAWTGDYYPGDTTGQGIAGFSVARL